MKSSHKQGEAGTSRSPRAADAMAASGAEAAITDAFRDSFRDASYYSSGRDWSDYAPAYLLGQSAFRRYRGRRFQEVEREIEAEWNASKMPSRLVWVEARGAVLDAWCQAEQTDSCLLHRHGQAANRD